MNNQTMVRAQGLTIVRQQRSALSLEFESHWRGLAKDGLVPRRSVFRPERAARMLRHMALCDVLLGVDPAVRMRLVGSEIEMRMHRDATGEDYLNFLPPAYRYGAAVSVREIVRRPCGLWQITPMRFELGYTRNVEITIFPIRPDDGRLDQLLVLAQFTGEPVFARSHGDAVTGADTALDHTYIDVGAGVPN